MVPLKGAEKHEAIARARHGKKRMDKADVKETGEQAREKRREKADNNTSREEEEEEESNARRWSRGPKRNENAH